MSATLIKALREELRGAADPAKAPGMQAYMKSAMPFLGVQKPVRSAVCKRIFAAHPLATAAAWRAACLSLWRSARYREERYAAVDLTGDKRYRAFQTLDALPMYEELIVDGAWWDYVDEVASHRLGPLLRLHPAPMRKTMLRWSRSTDLWKRRSAIICQLGFKADTDLELLYACIEPALDSKEFFLRKAIGWALRQHAWTDQREVARYVREMGDRLSPLSRREALKNLV